MEIFSILGAGFLFGIKHAFDPDHMAALAALQAESNERGHAGKGALKRGLFWSGGHFAALLIAAAALFALDLKIPVSMQKVLELVIAGILLYMAVKIIFSPRAYLPGARIIHNHPPAGIHSHKPSFFIGFIHGLAGGAVVALAAALISSPLLGFLYIIVLSAGVTAGTACASLGIGLAAKRFYLISKISFGLFSAAAGATLTLSVF